MQSSEIVTVIEIDDNDSVRPDIVPALIKTIGDLLDAGKVFDSKDVSYPVHFVALAANGACAVMRFAAGGDSLIEYVEELGGWQAPIQMLLADNGGVHTGRLIVRAKGS